MITKLLIVCYTKECFMGWFLKKREGDLGLAQSTSIQNISPLQSSMTLPQFPLLPTEDHSIDESSFEDSTQKDFSPSLLGKNNTEDFSNASFDFDLDLDNLPLPPAPTVSENVSFVQEIDPNEKLLMPPHEHESQRDIENSQKKVFDNFDISPPVEQESFSQSSSSFDLSQKQKIEDEKIPDELPDLEIPPSPSEEIPVKLKGPFFINVEDYKHVLDDVNIAKTRFSEYAHFTQKINDLSIAREKAFEKWRTLLEDCERKLVYLDRVLFEEV